MDWNSNISTTVAVLSMFGGAFAYYQTHFSKKAKADAIKKQKLADLAERHLEAMDDRTGVSKNQIIHPEYITGDSKSESSASGITSPGSQYVHIDRIGKNEFVIINQKDTPLVIEFVRNRDEFVRITLNDNFAIQPGGQKTFFAVGAMQKPLPDNLILDETGQDQPLHLKLPR
ncbi:hypothetical protein [Actinomyces graevenitzii]|uniref:hypothetical protein n=1 Tax=Actinomyces graevenitzii TaxID=55565 RepID=UPI0011AF3C2F|nr:hypothetical protein [Actinomyces graevenitzii]